MDDANHSGSSREEATNAPPATSRNGQMPKSFAIKPRKRMGFMITADRTA